MSVRAIAYVGAACLVAAGLGLFLAAVAGRSGALPSVLAAGLVCLCLGFLIGRHHMRSREAELETIRERLERQTAAIGQLAEEAHEARTTLLDAIESTQEGFSIFDKNDRLVLCNAPFRGFYPQAAEALTPGADFRDIIRTAARGGAYGTIDDLECFIDHRVKRRRSRAYAVVEESLADGRWVRISNHSTRTGGVVNVLTDISDAKAREQALSQAYMRLEQQAAALESQAARTEELASEAHRANRAKSEFLAMISHEIRTPMNAVMGFCQLLRDTELSDDQRLFSDGIDEAAQNLLALVNDILDISRLESGRMELRPSDFNLEAMLARLLNIARVLIAEKPIELRYTFARDLPQIIHADRDRLHQIVLNLLANAVKFTEAGCVEVVAGRRTQDGKNGLYFEIRDTGIGIPESDVRRLFKAFEQGRSQNPRGAAGSGMGLAISKRLADLMGGTIGLCERAGYTTTFRVDIPLVDAAEEDIPSPQGSMEPLEGASDVGRRALRILVAEDTPASRVVVVKMLERNGHTVHAVADGQEALDAVRAMPFDLVILDIQMPRLDGFTAAMMIRRLPAPANAVPIFALSAQAHTESRERAMQVGFDRYLVKPLRQADLEAAVDEIATASLVRPERPEMESFVPQAAAAGEVAASSRACDIASSSTERLPPEEPQPEASRVDGATLRELKGAVGAETFEDLLQKLRANTVEYVLALETAAENRDLVAMAQAAHRCAGLFGQFGLEDIAVLARRVEDADDQMRSACAVKLLTSLHDAIRLLDDGALRRAAE
ncbi:ATP-binding protein [Breoghania sp. JC706]|uniref:ATP-binding protein n=1 Tax=Breoghania sp. JC706 TaxID=3117732 RepID=UPI00300AE0DC